MFGVRVDVYHHWGDDNLKAMQTTLERMLAELTNLQRQGEKIMATQQELLDQIKKIDEATTKQSAALQKQADTLQNISDDIDRLIATLKAGGVDASTLAALQAQADKVQAISDKMDEQAAFSDSVAKKADDVVPLPVPVVP